MWSCLQMKRHSVSAAGATRVQVWRGPWLGKIQAGAARSGDAGVGPTAVTQGPPGCTDRRGGLGTALRRHNV